VWHAELGGEPPFERGEPLGLRPVDQVHAVDVQRVEREERERHRRAEPLDAPAAAEPAHRDLERLGPAVGPERDRLAVEHDRAGVERRDPLDDLGHSVGDVGEVPRERSDAVARSMNLDPRAVELPLHRGRRALGERLREVGGGLGEHRLDRLERAEPEPGEAGGSVRERRAGDRSEVRAEHQRAPDGRRRDLRGPSHRLQHQALERALPHLAGEQTAEEPLLVLGRPPEQLGECGSARGLRSRAGSRADPAQGRVHREQLERGTGFGRHRQLAQGGPADADRPVRERAREVRHRERDLLWSRPPQRRREQLDLARAGARGGHPGRGQHEVVEEHHRRMANGVPVDVRLRRCERARR